MPGFKAEIEGCTVLFGQAYGAFGLPSEPEANYLPAKKVPHGESPVASGLSRLSSATKLQVAVLVWTHSVIGWGFTLLQNWIPTILVALGMTDLGSVGFVSALPWVVSILPITHFQDGLETGNCMLQKKKTEVQRPVSKLSRDRLIVPVG